MTDEMTIVADTCDACGKVIEDNNDTIYSLGIVLDHDPGSVVPGTQGAGTFGLVMTCSRECQASPRILGRNQFSRKDWRRMVQDHKKHLRQALRDDT
jgi:hypothetical protein